MKAVFIALLAFSLCPPVLAQGKVQPLPKAANPWDTPTSLSLFMAQKIKFAHLKANALGTITSALANAGDFKRALEVAQKIESANIKASALSNIAEAQVETGNKQRAMETLIQALEVVRMIEDKESKSNALTNIALAGALKQALEVAQMFKDNGYTRMRIIWALARAGDFKQALEVAHAIEDKDTKMPALKGIVRELARAGDFQRALEVAQAIEHKPNKASVLSEIAFAQVKLGNQQQASATLMRAVNVARAIQDKNMAYHALGDIANALARAKDKNQNLLSPPEPRVAFPPDRRANIPIEIDSALGSIVSALVSVEYYKQGVDVAKIIEDAKQKAGALRSIARALGKKEDNQQAVKILIQSLGVARTIENQSIKTNTIMNIVFALVNAGDSAQSLGVAQTIEDEGTKVEALSRIAYHAQKKATDKKQAMGTLMRAVKVARSIQNRRLKAGALNSIARSLNRVAGKNPGFYTVPPTDPENRANDLGYVNGALGNIASALALAGDFKQALELAQKIGSANIKASTLSNIAEAQIVAGNKKQALTTLKQASEVAQNIESKRNKQRSLIIIASDLAKAGDFKQSWKVVQTIDDAQKDEALNGVASALAMAGDLKRAMDVAQAIEFESDKAIALSAIATAGGLKQALEVAQEIEHARDKASILRAIAQGLAQAGDFKQAMDVAQAIEDDGTKVAALEVIITELTRAGDFKQAFEVFRKIKDRDAKLSALSEMAAALITLEDKQQALVILKQVMEVAQKERVMLDPLVLSVLGDFINPALAQLNSGDKQQALTTLKQVLAVTHKIQRKNFEQYPLKPIIPALENIVSTLVEARDKQQALTTLKQVLAVVLKIEDNEIQSSNLGGIASALGNIVPTLAKATEFKQALEIARMIEGKNTKIHSLINIALGLVELGDKQSALKTLMLAEEEAWKIKDFGGRGWAISEVSTALVKAGEINKAIELDRKARTTQGIVAGNILGDIIDFAAAKVEAGDKQKALVTLKQAKATLQKHDDLPHKADALRAFAAILFSANENQQALTTLKQAMEVAGKIDQRKKIAGDKEFYLSNKFATEMAFILAFELMPNKKNVKEGPMGRMKKAFTPDEKQIAKQLVQAVQENNR